MNILLPLTAMECPLPPIAFGDVRTDKLSILLGGSRGFGTQVDELHRFGSQMLPDELSCMLYSTR